MSRQSLVSLATNILTEKMSVSKDLEEEHFRQKKQSVETLRQDYSMFQELPERQCAYHKVNEG